MPESSEEVAVMEVRTVRRRLTQSTLFPHKAQERSGERDNPVRQEENGGDGEDAECGGSQGRRKRKANGKGTVQAKTAKKTDAKGMGCLNGTIDNQDSPVARSMKSPRKRREKKQTTPEKSKTNNSADPGLAVTSTSSLAIEEKTKSIPNLRLEAKSIAEENSRIFGGKQIHPFFSSRKSSKVIRETVEAEANNCIGDKNNSSESPGPIHVFESSQGGAPAPDWSRWIFLDRSIFSCNRIHEKKDYTDPRSSVDFGKVKFPSSMPSIANGISGGHLAPAGNSFHHPTLAVENVEHVISHTDHHDYCLGEKNSSVLRIRTKTFSSWDNDVLWTKKYQPEKATEVCGNSESVKYLSEWLHLWHGKALQCRDSANRGMKITSQSADLDYYDSDCDSEKLSQGSKLKNVLLVSGPTGSGKSASIYACAREQGFNVIEVNTSDWRNGALVKQKFGEALESHRVKRLNENQASHMGPILDSLNHHVMSQEADHEVVELTTEAIVDGSYSSINMSAKVPCARSKLPCDKVQLKTLVLFEDVDIAFTEDRGFISAVQHLARTAKLPIILTTNGNQSILPDSLDREEIYFSRPSRQEILGHIIEICSAEKANIEPSLIPRFIDFFHGDIRKTITHLQFWCQNAAHVKDTPLLEKCGPRVFDLEAAHQLLMKFIPWGLASELSELIDFKLNKVLSLLDEYSNPTEVNNDEHLSEIRQQSFQAHLNEEFMAAKKDEMLKRSTYYDQFEPEVDTQELSNSSGSPITFSRRNIHKKSDCVLSLSGDDDYDCECPTILAHEASHAGDDLADSEFMTCGPKPEVNIRQSIVHNESSPRPIYKITPFQSGENFESQIQVSQNNSQILDSCGVVDMSCVPESSFVPETSIIDEQEESCRSVSYVPSGDITTVDVKCYDECLSRLHINPHNMVSGFDINVESIHLEDVGDSHTEHFEVSTRRWQLMDECSQMNFNKSTPKQHNAECQRTGSVQEAWNCLRESRKDLGKYVSEQKYASQFLMVAFGASNLLSEADILVSDFRLARNTSAGPSAMLPEKSDTFQWYDEQLHMTSTLSNHGLSLYCKEANAALSNMDQASMMDLSQDVLTYSSDTIRLGNIGAGISEMWPLDASDCGLGVCAPSEREDSSTLLDIIRSIVPPRSYLAMRGEAMHEYISSLNTISRSETSRLSVGVDKTKRRGRVSRHYLSGDLSLSPEDISILNRYPFGSHKEDA